MKRIAILLGAGLALACLTGCPPSYPKCSNDEACKEHNEVCVQGQCLECATDGQCKPGFTCQANKCAPKPPECQPGSTSCGQGKRCEAGKCVANECESNTQCQGKGGKCAEGKCVQRDPGTCDAASDCGSEEKCEAGRCVALPPKPPQVSCDFSAIRFGFNEATLTDDARQHLSQLADCLKQDPSKVRLEGYADERGTEEYNLLLSQKRATSAKKYLTDLGVPEARLDTVGFGENKPVNPGHDEEAWAENRRVELKQQK